MKIGGSISGFGVARPLGQVKQGVRNCGIVNDENYTAIKNVFL